MFRRSAGPRTSGEAYGARMSASDKPQDTDPGEPPTGAAGAGRAPAEAVTVRATAGETGNMLAPGAGSRPPVEPEPAGSVLRPPYRALSLGIVSVVLLVAFEATAVGTAMPVAAQELDGVPLYAYAFSAFFTTSLVGMVVSGQWCDRRGPLAPLGTGIVAFAAGLLLAGTAGSMWTLVFARAVQGIGGGLVIVALYVVVSRAYPEALRPKILAAFSAAWVLPSAVGPLIAGTVTEHLGWRWVFLGIPALVLLPLAAMLPPLRRAASGPPEGAEAPGPWDVRRTRLALGVAAGAGLLQYAGQELRWFSLVPAVVGAGLLVPAALALLPRGTYRAARGLPAVILLRGVAASAYVVAESFVPLMLVTQRGLSVTLAGLTLAAGGAAWALGSYLQARSRLEPYRAQLVRLGMVFVALSIVYVPLVLVESVPVWTLALTMALGCFGMGLVISSMSVLLLRLSPPAEAGRNSSALQVSDSLSTVVLLACTGAVFAALGGGTTGAAHTGATAEQAAGGGAFVGVYAVAAAVAVLGVAVAGRVLGSTPAQKSP